MYGILNFKWFKNKIQGTKIIHSLKDDCEYAEKESRIYKNDTFLYRVYCGIPVVVRGVTDQLRNDRFVGIQIEVLTGCGKGIRHFMNPVTDLALKKVVKDILNTKPWGIPWAAKLVPKDGVYWREEFDSEGECEE